MHVLRTRTNSRLTSALLVLLCFYVIDAATAMAQKRLPYVAMHNPAFIPASSTSFLHDEDRVIGVAVGKTAKAYPAAILAQHGLVEDQSPDGPIAITW